MSRSPAWWTALALLVANDHLLKGASLLPGWLTGKLSDLAGLIVAPVLAAALLRAGRARSRALAFALVVLPFVAIKVSPAAARGLVALVGALGIRWRIWCDPTDLLALAVLPIAWRVGVGTPAATPARAARWRRVVAVGLASAACLASLHGDSFPEGYRTSAYLVNMALHPVPVSVYRVDGTLDCAALARAPETGLASSFRHEGCVQLDPGMTAPLDRVWWRLEDIDQDAGSGPPEPACDAVIVRISGLPDTLLTWQAMPDVDVNDPVGNGLRHSLDPQAVYLEPAGDRLFLVGSSLIAATPSTIALPDIACESFDGGRSR